MFRYSTPVSFPTRKQTSLVHSGGQSLKCSVVFKCSEKTIIFVIKEKREFLREIGSRQNLKNIFI